MCYRNIGEEMFGLIEKLNEDKNKPILNKAKELYYKAKGVKTSALYLKEQLGYDTMTCKKAMFYLTHEKEMNDFTKDLVLSNKTINKKKTNQLPD